MGEKAVGRRVAVILVLLAAGCWGCMGIFVRYFNGLGLQAMNVVFLRVLVAVVFLPVMVLAVRPASFRIHLRDLWCFAGTGILSIAMFSYCYFKTIALTSLSVAAVLLYSAPVMVVLLSALIFKERITRKKALACLLAFLGCLLVGGLKGEAVPAIALLTGFLSAFGYALYSIFSRVAMNRGYHSFTIILYTFFLSLFGVVPFADIPATFQAVQAAGAGAWGMVLLMGLITAVLPYLFYTLGLSGLEAGRASIMASLEPVVATLIGMAAFHEMPTAAGFLGILLVLAGVVLLNAGSEKV